METFRIDPSSSIDRLSRLFPNPFRRDEQVQSEEVHQQEQQQKVGQQIWVDSLGL